MTFKKQLEKEQKYDRRQLKCELNKRTRKQPEIGVGSTYKKSTHEFNS